MNIAEQLKRSTLLTLWFVVLTFPIMIIRVNTVTDTIVWRWDRLLLIAIGAFVGSFVWNFFLGRKKTRQQRRAVAQAGAPQTTGEPGGPEPDRTPNEAGTAPLNPPATDETWLDKLLGRFGHTRESIRSRKVVVPALIVLLVLVSAYPFLVSFYQTGIMVQALIYVILALGLNIVIGLGGMLHLGYAAFYAVGAYTYALLNQHFGLSFWLALPLGAGLSAIFGVLLAIPVLRLRGDYLAIVTLGFAEIVRIILVNWTSFSGGPSGIKAIDRPGFFGVDFGLSGATIFTYFICVGLVALTIFIVNRMENSRIGRQWVAMGEDDIAARAMGVDTSKAKLTAFAMGALWAGLAGVVFAARTTFVSPQSFQVWESVLILSMVVLGGMGSIPGVIIGALALILLPEYLRAFSEYRLLIFGALLVIMVVFKPAGLIPRRRKQYKLRLSDGEPKAGDPPPAGPMQASIGSNGGAR
ncbi:MAG: ABC transporter permease subunit [Spirochaetales bacterium]